MSDTKQAEILILDIIDAELRERLGFDGCAFHSREAAETFAVEATQAVYPGAPDFVPEGDYSRPWADYRVVAYMDGAYSRGTVRVRTVRAMDLGGRVS